MMCIGRKRKNRQIFDKQSSYIYPFIENINTINALYNHPINMFFDEENIYLEPAEESIS